MSCFGFSIILNERVSVFRFNKSNGSLKNGNFGYTSITSKQSIMNFPWKLRLEDILRFGESLGSCDCLYQEDMSQKADHLFLYLTAQSTPHRDFLNTRLIYNHYNKY
ncbi:hypothetical protein BpHYR1_046355 [Brachionus plicatilis]|uniref:Uncharacterized protein n=1 Tax=Brachionus plicatilis TaxID=10195 RepID=A0A3M7PEJ5_BRAPC|nr:hypothetical protein BpHYR1_046355 [Brachionus plicatilis]